MLGGEGEASSHRGWAVESMGREGAVISVGSPPPVPADPRAVPAGPGGGEGEVGAAQTLSHQGLSLVGEGWGGWSGSGKRGVSARPGLPSGP